MRRNSLPRALVASAAAALVLVVSGGVAAARPDADVFDAPANTKVNFATNDPGAEASGTFTVTSSRVRAVSTADSDGGHASSKLQTSFSPASVPVGQTTITGTVKLQPNVRCTDLLGGEKNVKAIFVGTGKAIEFLIKCPETAPPVAAAIDATPPTIDSVGFGGTPGSAGWYRSGGSVTVACSDDNPGATGSSDPASLSGDGEHSVSVTCTDVAGNTTSEHRAFAIDGTAPIVTIASPSGSYVLGQPVAASFSCSDVTSGVSSCSGPVASGSPVSTAEVTTGRAFTVDATDAAGNGGSATSTYSVRYGVCGGRTAHSVMSPFRDGAISIKQGRDVPVKIQVCDWTGAPVTSGVTARLHGPTLSSQNSHPSPWFRVSDDKLIYNLSTDSLAVSATPHAFTVTLNDGSTIPFKVTVTK